MSGAPPPGGPSSAQGPALQFPNAPNATPAVPQPIPGVLPANASVPRVDASIASGINAMSNDVQRNLVDTKFLYNNYFEYYRRGITNAFPGYGVNAPGTPWGDAMADPYSIAALYSYDNARQCQRLNGRWESIYLADPLRPGLTARQARLLRRRTQVRSVYRPGGSGGGGSSGVPPNARQNLQRDLNRWNIPITVKRVFSAGGMVSFPRSDLFSLLAPPPPPNLAYWSTPDFLKSGRRGILGLGEATGTIEIILIELNRGWSRSAAVVVKINIENLS